MRPNWIKVALLLAVFWAVVGGAMFIVRKNRQTPQRIAEFVAANALEGKSDAERSAIITGVADRVNRLEGEQRQELNRQRIMLPFWNSMNDAEKGRYLDLVLPKGFKQMIENFNKMEPSKRKRMVQKAVDELRSGDGDRGGREVSDAQMRKIVEQGLKSFYSDATIDAKMDAMPFLEALGETVKWSR